MSNININAGNLEVMLTNALNRIKALGHEELGLSKSNFDYVIKLLMQMISMVIDGIQEHEIIDLRYKAQELVGLLKGSSFIKVAQNLTAMLKFIDEAIAQIYDAIHQEFGEAVLQSMAFNQFSLHNLPKVPSVKENLMNSFPGIFEYMQSRSTISQSDKIMVKLLEALEGILLAALGIGSDAIVTDDLLAGNAGVIEQLSSQEDVHRKKKDKNVNVEDNKGLFV